MGPRVQSGRRRNTVAVSAVLAVALVGFFIGVRQGPSEARYYDVDKTPASDSIPAARSHAELAVRPWRTQQPPWWPPQSAPVPPVTTRDKQAYDRAIAARAERRAFEGAPPTIPHPIGDGSAEACLACHERGARIGEALAPPMSHTPYTMCTQCHVVQAPRPFGKQVVSFVSAGSSFEGVRAAPAPHTGIRGAPPQIPHASFMRERCQSCHGADGRPGLQTSHPERASCQQCHAASAIVDQHPESQ